MKVNDKIPELILKDQNNQDIHVYEALKEDPVILYFYPKGTTLRFTREACGFRVSCRSLSEKTYGLWE